MIIYNYSSIDFSFTYKSEAEQDPLDPSNYLIPAFATTIAPPTPGEHQASCFINGAWQFVENWIGVPYYLPDGTLTQNDSLGPLPTGATFTKPPATAIQNKNMASSLLYQTDWTTIADVGDPTKSNPYLTNVAEFQAYRNILRQIAVNPVSGNLTWPTMPRTNWSTTT
jgi:hypothetical protein